MLDGGTKVEFFSKIFTWFANLSSKLPQIDLKSYFIVVLAVIGGVGLIVGLTFFGSKAHKLKAACKKIIKYLGGVDSIDDDNVGDFTAECFSQKAPQSLRDSWVEYLGVRFGYPSDLVSEKNVYDKEIKKVKDVRANLYIGIALILVAIFAFWGFGTLSAIEMSVIHCAGLLLAAVVYLVLVFLNRKQIATTRDAFYNMQDELDAKVNFQVEKNFATDSSPLADLAAMVDEIIARNTAKEINIKEEEQEPTPIENLIDQMESEHYARQAEEEVAKLVEESRVEEPAPVEEPTEEPAEEPASVQEEPVQETVEELVPVEQNDEEPQAEEVEEPVEEPKKEPVALKESLAAARKAGHAVVGKKFFGEYLKGKYGDNVEVNERENKTSTGLPLADTYFALDENNRKCFAYAYEIDGASLLLVNADSEFEAVVKDKHDINLSAFPKSKDEWYSLPLDETYTEDELKGILDYCYAHALGREVEIEPQEPEQTAENEDVEEIVEEEPALVEEPVEEQVQEEPVESPQSEEPAEESEGEEPAPLEEPSEEEPVDEPVEEAEEPVEELEEPVEETGELEEVEDEQEDVPVEDEQEVAEEEQAEEPENVEPEEDIEEEQEVVEESESDDEPEEENEEVDEPDADESDEQEDEQDDETVVYVVDGEEEDDDYVQPARLSKLSNLTDYMLAQGMSKKVKMQVAQMLIGVYAKFKDSPEDKKIIVDCLKKVIFSLQQREETPVEYVDESVDANDDADNADGEDQVEGQQEPETNGGLPLYKWN